jgi:arsenate reductase
MEFTTRCAESPPAPLAASSAARPFHYGKVSRLASIACGYWRVTSLQKSDMTDKIYNVLFICTGNSARSIMAEVVLNQLGRGRFKAYSAGSHPRGEVHPVTLEVLAGQHYDVSGLRSKSWTEFAAPDAPSIDFIFTVCDHAAGETCPAWSGQPITAQWGFADPAAVVGEHEKQLKAFRNAQFQISTRIRLFLNLPIDKIDRLSLQRKLRELGQQRDE